MRFHFRGIAQIICRSVLMCAVVAAGVSLPAVWSDAQAQVRIVALGASNTKGKGVSLSEAYPAQLQGMLKAKGVSATVANAGINGDTTGGMLARLDSAVPSGTQLVILQPGGNDRRRGSEGSRAGNIAQIKSRLAARKIKVVVMENTMLGAIPASERQPDGTHFTPKGYARLAAGILPSVLSVIGK